MSKFTKFKNSKKFVHSLYNHNPNLYLSDTPGIIFFDDSSIEITPNFEFIVAISTTEKTFTSFDKATKYLYNNYSKFLIN